MADPVQKASEGTKKPLEHPIEESGLPSSFGSKAQTAPTIPKEYLGRPPQVGAPLPPIKMPEGLIKPKDTTPVTSEVYIQAQPKEIPATKRRELEKKAKTLINELDNTKPNVTSKPESKGKLKQGVLVGISSFALLITSLGVFFGIKLLGTERSADVQEQAAECGSGCGNEPSGYAFNRPPSVIGPFTQDGKLVVYYTNLGGGEMTRKIKLKYNGNDQVVEVTAPDRERKVTSITVNAGETVSLESVEEVLADGLPDCAPDRSQPYKAWGWIPVNNDSTCGSGLPGPPSACTPFGTPSVTDQISWATGSGDQIVAKQCWADTREWPGDYDFNDFFLQFGIEPTASPALTCSGVTLTPAVPLYGSTLTLTCAGTPPELATYADFQVKRGTTDYQSITNKTATTAEYVVNQIGTYSVRCRMCTDETKTTCTEWQTATQ